MDAVARIQWCEVGGPSRTDDRCEAPAFIYSRHQTLGIVPRIVLHYGFTVHSPAVLVVIVAASAR